MTVWQFLEMITCARAKLQAIQLIWDIQLHSTLHFISLNKSDTAKINFTLKSIFYKNILWNPSHANNLQGLPCWFCAKSMGQSFCTWWISKYVLIKMNFNKKHNSDIWILRQNFVIRKIMPNKGHFYRIFEIFIFTTIKRHTGCLVFFFSNAKFLISEDLNIGTVNLNAQLW